MAQAYLDFTDAEVPILQALAELQARGELLTKAELNAALLALTSSFQSKPVIQSVTLVSGDAAIERLGKISYVQLDTEGAAFTDDWISITEFGTNSFTNLDIVIAKTASSGRDVVATQDGAGNLSVNNSRFILAQTDHIWAAIFVDGQWSEIFRYPDALRDSLSLANEELFINAGVVNRTRPMITLKELTGETRATATLTITGLGAAAQSIDVQVDKQGGDGSASIGGVSYLVAPATTTIVAEDLSDSIFVGSIENLNPSTGFNASNVANLVTVTAPIGAGTDANVYEISTIPTGGMTATNSGTFAGGLAGTETAGTLDTINAGAEGDPLVVFNGMATAGIQLATAGNIASTYALAAGEWMLLIFKDGAWVPQRENPLTKSGIADGADFDGNPDILEITFNTPFPNANYSPDVIGQEAFTWSVQALTATGFTINSNQNSPFTTPVYWKATANIDP